MFKSEYNLVLTFAYLFFFYIWSEYGDEITVDKEQKLVRWNPTQKKIAQRINMSEKRHIPINKKTIEIKRLGVDPTKLHFLIFAVKLSHNLIVENNTIAEKWPSLLPKNGKKCPFYEEKSFVRLTLGRKLK